MYGTHAVRRSTPGGRSGKPAGYAKCFNSRAAIERASGASWSLYRGGLNRSLTDNLDTWLIVFSIPRSDVRRRHLPAT